MNWVAPSGKDEAAATLENQNLRQTRDLLLPRLLSGQIELEMIES